MFKVDFLVKFYLAFFLLFANSQAYGSELFLEMPPGVKKTQKTHKSSKLKMLWTKAMFPGEQRLSCDHMQL